MSENVSLTENGNTLALSGVLDVKTATAILKKSQQFIKTKQEAAIDFSKVAYADSAALALILHWRRQVKQQNTKITLKNIPEQIRRIAKLSELDQIIFDDKCD